MKKNITINFTLDISNNVHSHYNFQFYQWIPENIADAIVVNRNNKLIKIYADKSCVSGQDITDEYLSRWINIEVIKLKVIVLLNDIDAYLASFIFDERDKLDKIHHGVKPDDKEYEGLQNKYIELATGVAKDVISACNKILSYARNIKGQYWLTELTFDENTLYNFSLNATSRIEEGYWFKWFPSNTFTISLSVKSEKCSINKNDWENISAFVLNEDRPNLVLELLSNARYLFDCGHMRSTVIEAVSALEVAVSEFGRNVNIPMLSSNSQNERIDIHNIGNQIDHLGFSGSLRFLIPLLFNNENLSTEVLKKCYEAIERRNNVVHNGQRNVDPKVAREILSGVSTCCKVLIKFTQKEKYSKNRSALGQNQNKGGQG